MYVNKSNLKFYQVTLKDYYAKNYIQNMYTEKYNIQSNIYKLVLLAVGALLTLPCNPEIISRFLGFVSSSHTRS